MGPKIFIKMMGKESLIVSSSMPASSICDNKS